MTTILQRPNSSLLGNFKDLREENLAKIDAIKNNINSGTIHGKEKSFQSALGQSTHPTQVFDGSQAAKTQAYVMQNALENEEVSDLVSVLTPKQLNEELKRMLLLIAEESKNPDPTKEKDSTQQTLAFITLMSAGAQMKSAHEVSKQSKLLKDMKQMTEKSQAGKKVQYRDNIFELRSQDANTTIFYRLGKDAAKGKLKIFDENMQFIQEIPLSELKQGDHEIKWDRSQKGSLSPAKDGLYQVMFELVDRDGKSFQDTEFLVELEGILSGVDHDENGHPIYFIGGQEINGPITRRLSKHTGEFEQLTHAFENYTKRSAIELSPIQSDAKNLIDESV